MEIKKKFVKQIKAIGVFIVVGMILGPTITHAYNKELCQRVIDSAIDEAEYLQKKCINERSKVHCTYAGQQYPNVAKNISNGINMHCK